MGRKRTPVIGVFFEEDGLPEAVHLFQVLGPAILNSFVKNVSQEFVFPYAAIKIVDQKLDVVQCADVFFILIHLVGVAVDSVLLHFNKSASENIHFLRISVRISGPQRARRHAGGVMSNFRLQIEFKSQL